MCYCAICRSPDFIIPVLADAGCWALRRIPRYENDDQDAAEAWSRSCSSITIRQGIEYMRLCRPAGVRMRGDFPSPIIKLLARYEDDKPAPGRHRIRCRLV